MKISVLIVSRNRPDLVQAQLEWLSRNATLPHDVYVVEAGSDRDKIFDPVDHPNVTTLRFEDPDFRGKAFAHNIALEEARRAARRSGQNYDYHWVLMNDVVFADGVDAMRTLVETMEREPRLGILSPTCEDGLYPASGARPTPGWRPVTTCDYLGFMIRGEVVETIGFLNPSFRYCWGAIHELSFLVHSNGLCVGYSDDVTYRHLGGTTYGAQGTNTISRDEYQRRAKRFAYAYMTRTYGSGWPQRFFAAAQETVGRGAIEIDTFDEHSHYWATAFSPEELVALDTAQLTESDAEPTASAAAALAIAAENQNASMNTPPIQRAPMHQAAPAQAIAAAATTNAGDAPLRLHLGCGPDKRDGWVNVDVNPQFAPDLQARADSLPMLPDASCEAIEACHLFEHLTLTQARAALREWRRLLIPGGELRLELPNLERCMALVGTEMNGHDLGMISLFGYPPEVDEQGEPQLHKWGWTPRSLAEEMVAAGFAEVREVPITQTHRPAAQFDRDMRLVAVTPGAVAEQQAAPATPTVSTTAAPVCAPSSAPVTAGFPTSVASVSAPKEPASQRPGEVQAVLAWPRYDDAAELDSFFHVFARVLSGRGDVLLFLRVDPERDPASAEVVAALEASHRRILGEGADLELRLIEGPLSPAEWREMGQHLTCRIRSGSEAAPRDAARQVPTPVVADAPALYSVLNGGQSCAPDRGEDFDSAADTKGGYVAQPGQQIDPETARQIDALHPWFYPVQIEGLTVVPGLGSVCAPEWLINRTKCRSTLLVEAILSRIDFRGKSVLDLACNCAFWSSHYALAGAKRLLGVEGRQAHVDQARLYWGKGGFLPEGQYEFRRGNISDPTDWDGLRASGPFDVTLCAGILYHIPNYAEVLEWAADVTNEVLIVDTRVLDGEEVTVAEPGDLTFNAIAETRDKIVPDRERLLGTLRELGFEPEVLPVGFAAQLGVDDVDCYADGHRVTIVARKVKTRASGERPVVTAGSGGRGA